VDITRYTLYRYAIAITTKALGQDHRPETGLPGVVVGLADRPETYKDSSGLSSLTSMIHRRRGGHGYLRELEGAGGQPLAGARSVPYLFSP
jgi:hypothetical protein